NGRRAERARSGVRAGDRGRRLGTADAFPHARRTGGRSLRAPVSRAARRLIRSRRRAARREKSGPRYAGYSFLKPPRLIDVEPFHAIGVTTMPSQVTQTDLSLETIVLFVSDLAASRSFYEHTLGLRALAVNPHVATYSAG